MMSSRAVLASLAARVATVSAIAAIVTTVETVLPLVDGWVAFLTPWEVAVSAARLLVFTLLAWLAFAAVALMLGTLAILIMPLRSRAARTELVAHGFLFLIVSYLFHHSAGFLLSWGASIGLPDAAGNPVVRVVVLVASVAAAVMVLRSDRRTRARTEASPPAGSPTRRSVIVTATTAAAISCAPRSYGVARAGPVGSASDAKERPNIVLVTFDALGAEHMSLYGCDLPTTPRIDAFARTATVFNNVYSCGTFTTPSVTSILTGRYAYDTHVHHLLGVMRPDIAEQTVVRRFRAAGYQTLAAVGNSVVEPRRLGIGADFSALAAIDTPFAPMSRYVIPLDAVLGSVVSAQEVSLAELCEPVAPLMPDHRAEKVFTAALDLVSRSDADRPFFLWVHVFEPHNPYLPGPPFQKRFLHTDEMRRPTEMELYDRTGLYYPPSRQPLIDKARLRYAESVAEVDEAFHRFMTGLDKIGRLDDTAVVMSADHGESFVGGVYRHGGPGQSRQIIHIPMIIRAPGQGAGRRVSTIFDQSSVAPTLLHLAGLPSARWMTSPSLLGASGDGGTAFTQYFQESSAFRDPRRGTVGIVEDGWQCIVDIADGRSVLRPLAEANNLAADRSAENPALAAALRGKIFARFPRLEPRVT